MANKDKDQKKRQTNTAIFNCVTQKACNDWRREFVIQSANTLTVHQVL